MERKSHYVPQFIIFPFFLLLVFVFYDYNRDTHSVSNKATECQLTGELTQFQC